MSKTKVGFLSIGQSPRLDLVAPLAGLMPAVQPVETGALDGLAPDELPAASATTRFPLTTRMQSGDLVAVDEHALLPYLARGLARLEEAGVVASLLLCAGTFAGLEGRRPLFVPFIVARNRLRQMGCRRLLVVCPIAGQVDPIADRWRRAGFVPTLYVAPSLDQDAAPRLVDDMAIAGAGHDCLLLDYVGHPPGHVTALRAALDLPVFDLGQMAAEDLLASGLLD